ncbi:diaminopimelate epimerase [Nigerium massiliense]|uniref:diaminopimelate epimerase n=1 Tax=Nigerium massiliense TaxID=1522317 RepID=UPI000590985E|nr:diaminopimelate epimerase [Nigerium massiliense]
MVEFAKGHGTLNDFVLLVDPDDERGLSDAQVRFLCDRRAGIGGDGVLRAVRARHIDGWDGDPDAWFMDYRNADGSVAEMCGNGARVFLLYLREEGLIPADADVVDFGTRAGLRRGSFLPDGRVRLWMGRPTVSSTTDTTVTVGGSSWPAWSVDVGNPHAVTFLTDADDLAALDLATMPDWAPAERFPGGTNLEFVEVLADDAVRMRVFERGVGETLSCGTGTVAVAAAMATVQGRTEASYEVQVPGGSVRVDLTDGQAWLTGPAVVVARGELSERDE